MGRIRWFPILVAVAVMLAAFATGKPDHTYQENDEVHVYADKMSPGGNLYETYSYKDAPGCPILAVDKSLTLGELLAGHSTGVLQTNINFNRSLNSSMLCQFKATDREAEVLKYYIKNNYSYELRIDGMPIWGAIGYVSSDHSEHIYLHRTFYIGIHNGHIVNVTLQTASPVKVTPNVVLIFTYSVIFEPSAVDYANRFSTVFETPYTRSRTRLVSLINSVLIILFLSCAILLIMTRTLRADYARVEQETQLGIDVLDRVDESGWRCLYADVFRVPRHTGLFCAVLGCGSQLLVLAAFGIAMSTLSKNQILMNRNLVAYTILGYVFSAFVAGYVSGYQFMGCGMLAPPMASKWIRAFHVAFMIAPVTYAVAFVPSTSAAILCGSAQVPRLKGIVIVVLLWVFIAYPLCLAGVLCSRYVFRRTERRRNIPHVNQIPRLIPRPPRRMLAPCTLLLSSGALPFISVFVELSFVFASLWCYKFFHLYGFLAMTIALYVGITACVSVTATFLLLSTENHHWKWMSIGFGASCSLYVLLYAVYFYIFKTAMHGLYMWVVYSSYCVMFALFLSIVGGTVSYFAASFLVKKIYSQAKHD